MFDVAVRLVELTQDLSPVDGGIPLEVIEDRAQRTLLSLNFVDQPSRERLLLHQARGVCLDRQKVPDADKASRYEQDGDQRKAGYQHPEYGSPGDSSRHGSRLARVCYGSLLAPQERQQE